MDNQQPILERKCSECGRCLPLADFPTYDAKGRRRHQCNTCWEDYHRRWRHGEVKTRPDDPGHRTCKVCGVRKPVELFKRVYAKNSRGANYYGRTCAECERLRHAKQMHKYRHSDLQAYRAYRKRYREKNLEVSRVQRRESGQRLKDAVFFAYGGYVCSCCGETCRSMLSIDHVHEDGSVHRNLLNGGRGRNASVDLYRDLRSRRYPSGLQVLCYNCNISKHRNGGVCEHALKAGSETIPKGSRAKRPEAQDILPGG